MPDLNGHLLAIEEVGERPYRIDRMLTQLMAAGALKGIKGVLVGSLTGCDDQPPKDGRPPSPTAVEVIVERLASLGVPVLSGLPMGHATPNHSFVQGAHTHVHITGKTAQLRVTESLYAAPESGPA